METSELIAMIREGVKGCDPGDTMIFPETGKIICVADLLEVANRLESLDKRWKITRVERDQARQMRERAERLLGEAQMELLELRRNTESVVHAHWKAVLEPNTVDNYGRPVYHAECSACGCKWGHVREAREWFKRCRLCGAHMDEEVVDE